MDDSGHASRVEQLFNSLLFEDACMNEFVGFGILQVGEIRWVARVSQRVQIDQVVVAVFFE